MSNEEIERFFTRRNIQEEIEIKITFKKREALYGAFIKGKDHAELKAKNLWRVVSALRLQEWQQSGDINLSKILSGAAINKLALK